MIDDLNISLDSINILKQNGIFTVGQLVETEIDDIEGLGFITREEVIWAREFFDFSKPVISDEKPYIKHWQIAYNIIEFDYKRWRKEVSINDFYRELSYLVEDNK